jgi:hypothetical protein
MMKRYIHIASMLCTMFFFASCKKETTISVTLFNPALNEYVPNATIVLNEIKSSGCTEIASAITDANGTAVFSKENLHTSSSYKYKLGIKESWGVTHQDPCSSQTQNFLNVGGTNNVQLSDYVDAQVKIQYNNVFSPGINGDSLICLINQSNYCDPIDGGCQGGGIENAHIDYNSYFPLPNPLLTQPVTIFANKLIVKIRKRKMGIVTTTIDTIKAYPNKTTTIQVNW